MLWLTIVAHLVRNTCHQCDVQDIKCLPMGEHVNDSSFVSCSIITMSITKITCTTKPVHFVQHQLWECDCAYVTPITQICFSVQASLPTNLHNLSINMSNLALSPLLILFIQIQNASTYSSPRRLWASSLCNTHQHAVPSTAPSFQEIPTGHCISYSERCHCQLQRMTRDQATLLIA